MPTATKNNSPVVDLDSFDMNIEEVVNNGKFIVRVTDNYPMNVY